jgi:hypothetical protein
MFQKVRTLFRGDPSAAPECDASLAVMFEQEDDRELEILLSVAEQIGPEKVGQWLSSRRQRICERRKHGFFKLNGTN